MKTHEVKVFWGRNFLITIGKTSWVSRDLFNTAKDPSDINSFHKIRFGIWLL
jgi:hypothetical protein